MRARNRSRKMQVEIVALGIMALFGTGCSLATTDSAPTKVTLEAPHLLYSVSARAPDARSVTLLPQPVRRTGALDMDQEARLYVGGMAAFASAHAVPGANRLALVVLAANDSIRPVLSESRQLLLDVDGKLFETHPWPDPRLYSFGPTELGYTETVVVPIGRELLLRIASADRVRGRIGHWLTFDVPPEVLDRLGDLLTALPEDFSTDRRRVIRTTLHKASF